MVRSTNLPTPRLLRQSSPKIALETFEKQVLREFPNCGLENIPTKTVSDVGGELLLVLIHAVQK